MQPDFTKYKSITSVFHTNVFIQYIQTDTEATEFGVSKLHADLHYCYEIIL